MEKKEDFLQEIVNLSDKDLKRIYEMACQKIKEGRLNGEDISLYETKLEVIQAELLRRTKSSSEKLDPNKMHPGINDPNKMHPGINDPDKMHPGINNPNKDDEEER